METAIIIGIGWGIVLCISLMGLFMSATRDIVINDDYDDDSEPFI